MASQNRTMSVSYRWTEDAKDLRQVTQKQTVDGIDRLPGSRHPFTKHSAYPNSSSQGLLLEQRTVSAETRMP